VFLDYPIHALAALIAMTAYGIAASKLGQAKTSDEYFLGSRSLNTFGLGSSLFVTSIPGVWMLGALVSADGIVGTIVLYGGLTVVFVLILGFYFAPVYCRSRVITVPHFLTIRFNESTGITLSGLTILFSVGVKIPLLLTLASWAFKNVFGWSMTSSAGLIMVVVAIGLYTIIGGFSSVVRTHVFQSGIFLAGGVLVAVWLVTHSVHAVKTSHPLLIPDQPLSMLVGLPIILAWHWWADQYTVQRILAASSLESARRGSALSAVLIVTLALFFLAFTGIHGATPIAVMLTGDPWLRTIGSIAFLSLLMASLASDFQSTATLFTMDFFKGVYADASEESLVLVGRLSTTLVVVLAMLAVSTASMVQAPLLTLMHQVQMHVAPPVVAVLVIGVLWPRMNSTGALWALVTGELFGAGDLLVRFIASINENQFGVLHDWASMNLFSFGILSLAVSVGVLVFASLATGAATDEGAARLSLLRRK